jgi:predicted DNA-binding transcriptional regulator AlpA
MARKLRQLKSDENSKVELSNGEVFDIAVDQLIDLKWIMFITGKSRSTIERWVRDGKFPEPHFRFNGKTARWVQRLVVKFIQDNWVTKVAV